MLAFLKWSVLTLLALIVALIGYGFWLPSSATVTRSVEIDAPPEVVFELLNGFTRFNEWSPWAGLDPDARYELEGPASGVGAVQRWMSEQRQVGSGRQEIRVSEPYRLIEIDLRFSGFEAARNTSRFELEPRAGGTRLTWAYESEVGSNLLGRYFLLLLDRMGGDQYQQGLLRLKALVEREAKAGRPDSSVDTQP